jgi:hypothetical protein
LANKNVAMAEPLSKAEKSRFSEYTAPLLTQLAQRAETAKKLQQMALNAGISDSTAKQ